MHSLSNTDRIDSNFQCVVTENSEQLMHAVYSVYDTISNRDRVTGNAKFSCIRCAATS